ncbi:hypothetical protein WN51_00924 [Melipona quadrifasciata]|uniref:Uncharacterized protein n=1 Tax=Melipona quadrifasciata TaxID=166423 RepID=A0A0M8ZYA2_9HYME|nr:hypothetical protein WN51_00924 [Melipona quadrifasciata]
MPYNTREMRSIYNTIQRHSDLNAPLCARDETARNIALAAARNTVEGWLGGVGSPNHWDDTGEMEDSENVGGKFKSQDGRNLRYGWMELALEIT